MTCSSIQIKKEKKKEDFSALSPPSSPGEHLWGLIYSGDDFPTKEEKSGEWVLCSPRKARSLETPSLSTCAPASRGRTSMRVERKDLGKEADRHSKGTKTIAFNGKSSHETSGSTTPGNLLQGPRASSVLGQRPTPAPLSRGLVTLPCSAHRNLHRQEAGSSKTGPCSGRGCPQAGALEPPLGTRDRFPEAAWWVVRAETEKLKNSPTGESKKSGASVGRERESPVIHTTITKKNTPLNVASKA